MRPAIGARTDACSKPAMSSECAGIRGRPRSMMGIARVLRLYITARTSETPDSTIAMRRCCPLTHSPSSLNAMQSGTTIQRFAVISSAYFLTMLWSRFRFFPPLESINNAISGVMFSMVTNGPTAALRLEVGIDLPPGLVSRSTPRGRSMRGVSRDAAPKGGRTRHRAPSAASGHRSGSLTSAHLRLARPRPLVPLRPHASGDRRGTPSRRGR